MAKRNYRIDSPDLGRFQFFIFATQEAKPGTPNQSGEKCVIAGDRPLFCRVAQLYAGLLRGTALRSHNSRTFTLSQLRQDYGLTPFLGARMPDGMQLICWTRALAWLTLSIMKMKKDRLDDYFSPADFSKCGEG